MQLRNRNISSTASQKSVKKSVKKSVDKSMKKFHTFHLRNRDVVTYEPVDVSKKPLKTRDGVKKNILQFRNRDVNLDSVKENLHGVRRSERLLNQRKLVLRNRSITYHDVPIRNVSKRKVDFQDQDESSLSELSVDEEKPLNFVFRCIEDLVFNQ